MKNREPDEFISFFDHLYHRLYARGPLVVAVFIIFLFVVVGTLFWRTYHQRSAQKDFTRLYEVIKKNDVEEIKKWYNETQKESYYAPLGMWAGLNLANQEKPESCGKTLEVLRPYVGRGEDELLRSLIYAKVGACLENDKDWAGAEELYSKASSDSENILKELARLRLAVVKQQLGKKEESRSILEGMLGKDEGLAPEIKREAKILLGLIS